MINTILNDYNKVDNSLIDNDISQIFILINKNPDAFKFVYEIKEEDCRNFQEMLDISDSNFLTLSDIQDLDICRKFLNDISHVANKIEGLTDRHLMAIFIEKVKSQKNISTHFKKFFDNYSQFKELKSQKLNISETNKTKSKKIANDSVFTLKIKTESLKNKSIHLEEENNFISFNGKYNIMENKKNISFNELLELREVSMLNKNINKIEEEKILEYNKKFIENIKGIIDIYNLLERISKNGYHKELCIEIRIKNNEISYTLKDFF